MARVLRATLAALLIAASLDVRTESATGGSWASRWEAFRVSYTSKLDPIVINRIHSWVLHVETSAGDPVEDARISIEGGMPQHDHGLPTAPEVTRDLGNGDYLVEGLRFHMNGYWELELTIDAANTTDTVVIPLTL